MKQATRAPRYGQAGRRQVVETSPTLRRVGVAPAASEGLSAQDAVYGHQGASRHSIERYIIWIIGRCCTRPLWTLSGHSMRRGQGGVFEDRSCCREGSRLTATQVPCHRVPKFLPNCAGVIRDPAVPTRGRYTKNWQDKDLTKERIDV